MSTILHMHEGPLTTTAEQTYDDKLRLHVRHDARCDSALIDLSLNDAWAIVDALKAYLPERAA